MPDIAITASPVAAISPVPGAAAASGEAAGPFAALLQQQMDVSLAAGLPDGLLRALAAAGDAVPVQAATLDPASQELGLENLLPALLGGKWPGSGETGTTAAKADKDEPAEVPAPDFLLGLPLPAAVILQPEPATGSAAAAGGIAAAAATPAADAAAILAAAPDAAGAEEAAAAPGFSALLAGEQGSGTAQELAAAHAASGQAAQPPVAARPATEAVPIPARVGTEAWDQQVGDRLVWMVGRHESRAELVLTPPQLGRIEVSLTVSGDQTNALFVSANPAVRDALESALPRLREMLADAGITLGQAQVGSEAPGQSAGGGENGDNRPQFQAGSGSDAAAEAPRSARDWAQRGGRGLVDVFA